MPGSLPYNPKGQVLCPSPSGRCSPDVEGRGPGAGPQGNLVGGTGDREPKSDSGPCGPAVVGQGWLPIPGGSGVSQQARESGRSCSCLKGLSREE